MKRNNYFENKIERKNISKNGRYLKSLLKNCSILLITLFLPIMVQAQDTEQIDSIKYQGTINDSLAFIVYSSIIGGVEFVDGIECTEAGSNVNVDIKYTTDDMDCICPWETTIKIKKNVYSKAIVRVMLRDEPEEEDYRIMDIKEIDLTDWLNITDDLISSSKVKIFPNPAASGQAIHYEIDLPVKSMNCRLEIFAIDGRLIHQEQVAENNGAVNLPNALPAGVYLVHFKTNNKISHTTRMIIN